MLSLVVANHISLTNFRCCWQSHINFALYLSLLDYSFSIYSSSTLSMLSSSLDHGLSLDKNDSNPIYSSFLLNDDLSINLSNNCHIDNHKHEITQMIQTCPCDPLRQPRIHKKYPHDLIGRLPKPSKSLHCLVMMLQNRYTRKLSLYFSSI